MADTEDTFGTSGRPGYSGRGPRTSGRVRTGGQQSGGHLGPASAAGLPVSLISPVNPAYSSAGAMGRTSRYNATGYNAGRGFGGTPGIPPAPEGTFDCYRQIRRDPTVAIGRAVVFGPIYASPWIVKSAKGAPQEWVDYVRDAFPDSMQRYLKGQLLFALDFGCRSFEQVYEIADGPQGLGRQLVYPRKFKPLRPDLTEVLVDKNDGSYAGLRNGGINLKPEETLHVPYDAEDDDWYGRSRFENLREDAWWPWKYHQQTLAKLGRKVSSIIPIVAGPINEVETGEGGRQISGFEAGMLIVQALTSADGVLVQKLMSDIDDLLGNPELAKENLKRWDITPFDTGSSAQAVEGILETLRYYDQLKMRGMLRPERTATEGQHGTKAEVAEQADVGLAEGEGVHGDLVQMVTWHSVDRLLAWNFGDEAVGQVWLEPTPLIDERMAVFKMLYTALLANPASLDLLAVRLDVDAINEALGIPTTGNVNDDLEGADISGVQGAMDAAEQNPAFDPVTGLPVDPSQQQPPDLAAA